MDRIPLVWTSFLHKLFMWAYQERNSSRATPRKLKFGTGESLDFLIFLITSSSSFFVLERKMTGSDFPELRESLSDLSHSAKFF